MPFIPGKNYMLVLGSNVVSHAEYYFIVRGDASERLLAVHRSHDVSRIDAS